MIISKTNKYFKIEFKYFSFHIVYNTCIIIWLFNYKLQLQWNSLITGEKQREIFLDKRIDNYLYHYFEPIKKYYTYSTFLKHLKKIYSNVEYKKQFKNTEVINIFKIKL